MQYVPPVLRSDDFVVEHLTDVPDHLRLLETFNSYGKASGLEIYLKELALRDEKAHESRTYLVNDAMTGELAAYFSLRSCLIPISVTRSFFDTIPAVEVSNFAVNENYRSKQCRKQDWRICICQFHTTTRASGIYDNRREMALSLCVARDEVNRILW